MVLDNSRFHHAKALTDLYSTGQELERITPIYMPPMPPTLGPTKHARDTARANIANPRALAPENTFAAFTTYITNRTFDHDVEHLPVTPPHTDLV